MARLIVAEASATELDSVHHWLSRRRGIPKFPDHMDISYIEKLMTHLLQTRPEMFKSLTPALPAEILHWGVQYVQEKESQGRYQPGWDDDEEAPIPTYNLLSSAAQDADETATATYSVLSYWEAVPWIEKMIIIDWYVLL